MNKFILIAIAFALETAALGTIWNSGSSDGILLSFFLQHAAASVCLAMGGWYVLPDKYRHPRLMTTLILFNFSFFIPLLGMFGLIAAVLFSRYHRHDNAHPLFAKLVWPEFVLSLREPELRFSQGGIRSRLAQPSIPTPQRLQSLLALQGIPARISSPLLQNMLGDSSDDIRLVAYGLLDSREKKITEQIHRELVNLKSADSSEMKLVVLRHLAELYWEMVYAGLAQGDLRIHTLNQALLFTDNALILAGQDTGLLFLKGRILHELKRHEEAQLIMESAITHGLPESRVLPYLVEIAFDRRDFFKVQNMLKRLSASQITPVMKNAIHFWVDTPEKNRRLEAKATRV